MIDEAALIVADACHPETAREETRFALETLLSSMD